MYKVSGNIIIKSKANGFPSKVAPEEAVYDQREYDNIFKVCAEMNKPHLERLSKIMDWVDNNTHTCELIDDLRPIFNVEKKAPPPNSNAEQIFLNVKKNWILAYNKYYDVWFKAEDLGLE